MKNTYSVRYTVWFTYPMPQEYSDAIHKAYELENENYHTEAGDWFDKAIAILDATDFPTPDFKSLPNYAEHYYDEDMIQ